MVDPPRNTLFSTCYYTKLGRSRSNRMDVGRGSQKFGDAGALPSWDGVVAGPLNETHPFPTCYRALGRCSSKQNVFAYVGIPKILGSLGPRPLGLGPWGVTDPVEIRPSSTRVTLPNVVVLHGPNSTSINTEIRRKKCLS